MENGICNGQLLIAFDIAKEYSLEKKVRNSLEHHCKVV